MQPVPRTRIGARILLAGTADCDDAISSFLDSAGCTVEGVSGGEAALAHLMKSDPPFHLVLWSAPAAGGYEALRRYRAWERIKGRPRTPVVAVAANAGPEEIERAIQAGADGHLSTPIERQSFLDAVDWYRRGEEAPELRVEVQEFLRDLAASFLRRQRMGLFGAATALRGGDFAEVQTFAHNLKGCGRSYGFPRLTEMGREMESAAKDRDAESLRVQIAAMREYLMVLEIA
jgi:CheY-like chemotaxis protein